MADGVPRGRQVKEHLRDELVTASDEEGKRLRTGICSVSHCKTVLADVSMRQCDDIIHTMLCKLFSTP